MKKNICMYLIINIIILFITPTNNINEIIYYKKIYSNNNIVGTLKIKDTNINTLLVKGSDNSYYLNHSVDDKYNTLGSIFMDYRTNFNSNKIIVYGHNSKSEETIFKELENYLNKDYYDKYKFIEIYNGINVYTYKIYNVNIVNDDSHIYLDNSTSDKILILQTCNYTVEGKFLLINSKLINISTKI